MKILLATDGSESAHSAVDCLMRFPFPSDSEVTMLTVIDRAVFKNEELTDLIDELIRSDVDEFSLRSSGPN